MKEHIFRCDAAATARGGVEVPIGGAEVRFFREAERLGCAIDCFGCAFQFEECASWCFIQVQVEIWEAEGGAEFVVAKGGAEA